MKDNSYRTLDVLDSELPNSKLLIEEFCELVTDFKPGEQYNYRSRELILFYEKIPNTLLRDFHIRALMQLIDQFELENQRLALPESTMRPLYEHEFSRIIARFADNTFLYDWSNDLFVKDLAICCGRLFPLGPGLIEISGIPRVLLIKNGPTQFFKFLKQVLFDLGGTKPVLENHTHLANSNQFTPEGWSKAYSVAADILKQNPNVIGFMRSSWFIDPEISNVSPKLSYLRETPEHFGAGSYYMCDEGDKSGSFARSKNRLRLFHEGKYRPRIYYLLWSREKIIEYALQAGR